MLDRLRVTYTPCQKAAVTDDRNIQYSPIGEVTLRWHKKQGAKSYSETFFVVDAQTALVILGQTAFPNISQSSGDNIHTLGLKSETAGTLIRG